MRSPIVVAPHQPTGLSRRSGSIQPSMDLSPAEEWGRLVFLLDANHNPFKDLTQTGKIIAARLQEEGFGPDDYLCLVGNPILMSLVTTLAACRTGGRLRFLQWSGTDKLYRLASATVDLKGMAPARAAG